MQSSENNTLRTAWSVVEQVKLTSGIICLLLTELWLFMQVSRKEHHSTRDRVSNCISNNAKMLQQIILCPQMYCIVNDETQHRYLLFVYLKSKTLLKQAFSKHPHLPPSRSWSSRLCNSYSYPSSSNFFTICFLAGILKEYKWGSSAAPSLGSLRQGPSMSSRI